MLSSNTARNNQPPTPVVPAVLRTAAHDAAAAGDLARLSVLLDGPAALGLPGQADGAGELRSAASNGRVDCVTLRLDRGSTVTAQVHPPRHGFDPPFFARIHQGRLRRAGLCGLHHAACSMLPAAWLACLRACCVQIGAHFRSTTQTGSGRPRCTTHAGVVTSAASGCCWTAAPGMTWSMCMACGDGIDIVLDHFRAHFACSSLIAPRAPCA